MRLTLRTLLAYLDDTLDPAQTKLIGQKVAESPTAQELINRIKEVVRRRRLNPPTGPDAKLEPNTIAEYIDNVLPAEQLAEVEEICLDSDVYLSELAACHQILTVVLSEPALVPPTARRRMYGLIKGREAIPFRRAAPAKALSPERSEAEGWDDSDEAWLLGLPMYQRKGAWLRRLGPIAAVLLLAAGLGFAIWKALPSQNKSTAGGTMVVAQGPTQADVHDVKPETKPEPKPETKAESVSDPDKNTAVKTEPKPETKPEPKPETKPEPKPETKPEVDPATRPEAKPPRTNRREAGRYVQEDNNPSVLLQRSSVKEPWQRVQHKNPVFTNVSLLSLPGYRSDVQLSNGVNLTLWGNLPDGMARVYPLGSAVMLHDNPEADLDLTLDHGRIAVTNRKPQGKATVKLRFLEEMWDLVLEPNAQAAVELVGMYLPGVGFRKKPTDEGPWAAGALYVLKGEATLHVRYETFPVRQPPGPALYVWDNSGPSATSAIAQDRLPPWANRDAQRPEVKKALIKLHDRLSGKPQVDVVLTELLRDTEPAARWLAVYGLGATDDLRTLIDALADEEHPEVRFTAIDTLRHWIGRAPDNDMKLYKVLEDKYKAPSAEIIMVLLHSFSKEELSSPETYESLLNYLKNEKLPIRELAFSHLAVLLPEIAKKIPYDPAGDSVQRDRAFEEWKKIIPDGQLPPKPAAPGGQPKTR